MRTFKTLSNTFLILLAFLIVSCSKKETANEIKEVVHTELFTAMNWEDTGLNFNNKLTETTMDNGFYYEYFYNGGGVAVADFNQDNLQDIYFISNLRTNKLYLNQGSLKFKNTSIKSNVQGRGGFPTGVTVVDINNDGLMDIYVLKSGRFDTDDLLKNELFINKGNDPNGIPIFEENSHKYGLNLPHHSTQASFFDYDRDGDLDMFLINHNIEIYAFKDIEKIEKGNSERIGAKLYKNVDGKFLDVTKEAGIISNNLGFGLGLAIGDVNNDNWPDIYVSNDYYEKDHLYLNNQNGTFTESSLKAIKHMSTFSMGNDIADINNDGLLDIISVDMNAEDNYTQKTSMSGMNVEDFYKIENLGLHRQYMYNALQLNNGNFPNSKTPAFSDIAQMANISNTGWSWAPLLFDMDNDGHRDLFISNGIKRDFRNNDFLIYLEAKYQEGNQKSKINFEQHVKEILEKQPGRKSENYFYLNNTNLTFRKLDVNHPKTFSNGAAYVDFDNDGDLDLIVNNVDDFALLYRNNQEGNNYLSVTLEGPKNNINGLGTKIILFSDSKTYSAENYFSRGYQSAMAIPVHFGLGKSTTIDSLEIIWSDGTFQVEKSPTINSHITIKYTPTGVEKRILPNYIFQNITELSTINFKHTENNYNDFAVESLLPHKMSQFGPCLAVSDVNNDGLEDFYVGGAKGQSGVLFVQTANGKFKKLPNPAFNNDKKHEDTGSLFLDADNDGDQDLYVVSGGNEKDPDDIYYQDRFYINDGQGNFTRSLTAIPDIRTSGQVIKPLDFDNDGDLDLFIGSRLQPKNYGFSTASTFLENVSTNGAVEFKNATQRIMPKMANLGMVTDALWEDINGDKKIELIIAQEWGSIRAFKMENNQFVEISDQLGMKDQVGWWNSLATDDIDNDGDIDLIAGNNGLNYKYKATAEIPFHLYLNDFDNNNINDIVLSYEEDSTAFPLRGRECSSNQMPFIKSKFKTYDAFGKASLLDVYGDALNSSKHMAATNFSSCILENVDNKYFKFKSLPNETQISSINIILTSDIDKDGDNDLILLGNLYGSEVETPRNDASYGHYLVNTSDKNYKPIPSVSSGLYIKGDVRVASFIAIGKKKNRSLLIAPNNSEVQLLKIN